MDIEIIPGILEKDWQEIERKIKLAREFSNIIHIDLIDGKFAENSTFLDPSPFEKYTKENIFELHMMAHEPLNYLDSFAKVGFRRFIGHVEQMSDQVEFVAKGQLLGEVGLAIDTKTPVSEIKVPFDDLDALLVMTVNAGYSGQKFNEQMLNKVKEIRRSSWLPIEVDGGINDETILTCKNAGVNRFVTTSFIFEDKNPQKQYQKLQELLNN